MLGRVPILQFGNCLYIIFNTACGAARTPAQMLAFRALSGLGGGAPLAVSSGPVQTLLHSNSIARSVLL
jgi:MFS family permease